MKKKGLIISTVVMVVVLIAALTTTTFAWFSTSASARIENLQVQAESAKGLQIADYTLQTSAAPTMGSWGLTYAFESLDAESARFMAVSGNGLDMYKLSDGAQTNPNGTPATTATVKKATANEDYFVGYLALKDTRSADEAATDTDIILKSINIEALTNDNNPQSNGLLASLRIAIFAKGFDSGSEDLDSFTTSANFTAGDLKLVYDPYAYYKYATGSGWSRNASPTQTAYWTAPGGFADNSTLASAMTKTETFETYVNGPDPSTVTDAPISFTTPHELKLTGDKNVVLKSNSKGADGLVYLMIVVWFEGQDNECISAFAGGGATIAMEFGIAAPAV